MVQTSLHLAFRTLNDPRRSRCRLHPLIDTIILSILAVLSGAESYDSIELFGRENYAFLKQFLSLPNGIPSHDTINRLFQALNPRQFEKCFIAWVQGLKDEKILEKVIAIDGKTLRGSKESFHGKVPFHMVHAWSVESGICLGQIQCDAKTNEITTIPEILDMLDIEKSIITIDAMGTQRDIATKIVENRADYILAVKGNQAGLEEEVRALCSKTNPLTDTTEVEKGHGRIEARHCQVYSKGIMVDDEGKWANFQSVIKITASRQLQDKTEVHERFYISSLGVDNDFNKLIRSHRPVENRLHWTLDMTFREDEQRKRAGHAAENFALVRKTGLNLPKKDKGKDSLRSKRLKAARSKDFLMELLIMTLFCTGLSSINIPNGVTFIGDYAFSESELTSIIIPNSVISIGNRAFQNCSNLSSFTISSGVTFIGEYAFFLSKKINCDNCSQQCNKAWCKSF
jgi:predicted transposase YbfD/YdcC